MIRVQLRCFFYIKSALKIKSEIGKTLSFELILGFGLTLGFEMDF